MTDKRILLFQQLSEEGWIYSNDNTNMTCFWFVFTQAMEAGLDYFTHWWNTHHMRKTHTASCPGGVPEDIFALPQLTGSEDYLCAVDPQLYDETYELLTSFQPSFYCREFVEAALSLLNMLDIDINVIDVNLSDCVKAYKCFVAAMEF
ncbi:uncharacterized protein LOC134190086 isoform X3 [Corticium candelabrum]|nr:uncharacterized protein LOC134190086 isoform X3 [Corticium candelabrum]